MDTPFLIETLPENAIIAGVVFTGGDVAGLLMLAVYLLGVFCLVKRLHNYIYRMPVPVVMWAKLVLAVFFAGAVTLAHYFWCQRALYSFHVEYNPLALCFNFLLLVVAGYPALSKLLSNGSQEKGVRVVISGVLLSFSMVLGHLLLFRGAGFEGEVFYLRTLFFQSVGLGALFTFMSVLLLNMAIYMHERRAALLPLALSAFMMAAAVFMLARFVLGAAVFVPEQQHIFITSHDGGWGMFVFGALLVLAMGAVFYVLRTNGRVFMGHGRVMGFPWVHAVPLVACAVVGVTAAITLSSATTYAEKKNIKSKFRANAQVLAGAVEHLMRGAVTSLDTMETFFAVSGNKVEPEAFRAFARQKMLSNQTLTNFAYLASPSGGVGFDVQHIYPHDNATLYGGRIIAGGASGGENEPPAFDKYLWRQALMAVHRNDVAVSHLDYAGMPAGGVFSLVLPVYKNRDRIFTSKPVRQEDLEAFVREDTEGFIVGLAHLAPLFKQAREISGVSNISMKLSQGTIDAVYQDSDQSDSATFEGIQTRHFGGQNWTFTFRPRQGSYTEGGFMRWGVLLVCLLLTAGLSAYFYATLRSQVLNRRVQKNKQSRFMKSRSLIRKLTVPEKKRRQPTPPKMNSWPT